MVGPIVPDGKINRDVILLVVGRGWVVAISGDIIHTQECLASV